MRNVTYLFKSITPLNLVLAVAVGYFGLHLLLSSPNVKLKYHLPAVKKTVEEKKPEAAQRQLPNPADYVVIADQNLFHPDRKIPPDKKAEAAAPPLPKPEFVLYGTLITGDMKVAYMEDKKAPQSTPGRGNRQSSLRVGEHLSGFQVREIDADKVLMVRGEEKISVPLSSPKTREVAAQTPGVPPPPGAAPAPMPGQAATPALQRAAAAAASQARSLPNAFRSRFRRPTSTE